MKKFLFISLLLCIVSVSMAQNITGRVVDENHNALAYANVTLLNANDSAFISGTVTDTNGDFYFTCPSEKDVLVHISILGYTSKILHSTSSLGDVVLQQDVKMLGSVL